jgi:DNA-binding transcriptional ArsR family regulator
VGCDASRGDGGPNGLVLRKHYIDLNAVHRYNTIIRFPIPPLPETHPAMPAATTKARPVKAPAEPAPSPELGRDEALDAARLLRMAGDATRLRILLTLASGPRNVGQLCLDLGGLAQPTCSHHTGLLRNAMLITPNRVSQHTYYDLTDRGRRLAGVIRMVVGAGGEEG